MGPFTLRQSDRSGPDEMCKKTLLNHKFGSSFPPLAATAGLPLAPWLRLIFGINCIRPNDYDDVAKFAYRRSGLRNLDVP